VCITTDDVHIHHLFVRCEPSSNQPRRSMKKFVDVRHVQDTLLLVTLNLCLIVMDNDVVCNAGMVARKEFLDDEVEDGELKEHDLSTLNVNLVGGIFTGKLGLS
jgi:hypothetical protein